MTPHSNQKDPTGEQQSQPNCKIYWIILKMGNLPNSSNK